MNAQNAVRSVRHGCVCFAFRDCTVYADPYLIESSPHDADLVIITHSHFDHYSVRDLACVINDQTHFITNADAAARLRKDFGIENDRITQIEINADAVCFGSVSVRAVPAVNKNHPTGFGFGAVIKADGFTYYLSGDTDFLCDVGACDLLFCVCDGEWNMPDYLSAVPHQITAMKTAPALVVPYHYGADHPASTQNGSALCRALQGYGICAAEWPFSEK